MTPDYVESGDFKCTEDRQIGCDGVTLRLRSYRMKGNPDQRPGNDVSHSIIKRWALAGCPDDYLIHYGSFYRITVPRTVG
jgi:hypothetical protein